MLGSDDELMGSGEDFLDSEENLQTTCARKKIRHDKVWFISSTGPTVKGAGQARAVQYTYRLYKAKWDSTTNEIGPSRGNIVSLL